MHNAQTAFGPTINDKILLLEFNTSSTTLFPYLNSTVARNQLI
jgi:hypothetical protein